MKFLVDKAISAFVAEELKKLGFDAIYSREKGVRHAKDEATSR